MCHMNIRVVKGRQVMIYTFTANPSIDYHMDLGRNGLTTGQINRSGGEEMFPGGKGLNVSVVLSRLGVINTAWGFAAGKTGRMLEELLAEYDCSCDFIYLAEGETRINVKLDCDPETAVNGKGPRIDGAAVTALLQKAEALDRDDTLILCGNLQGENADLYERLAGICSGKNARLIVDSEGESLRNTFRYHPFLIKPNKDELMDLFGENGGGAASIVTLMKRCREEGVLNVLVSLGQDGAVFLSQQDRLYRVSIRQAAEAVSTVGAGDSTIAGFLAGLERFGNRTEEALRFACAAGTATACRKWLLEADDMERVLDCINVEEIKQGL